MKAERLGSYSRRSTVAGWSHLRRLKSTKRYFCLWPPAMPRAVAWPWLLRPPDLRRPSVSALIGLPFHSDERSTRMRPRRAGEVGVLCFSALVSDPRRDVDRLGFGQRHNRLLHVRALVGGALPLLRLALDDHRVDGLHGDVEQRLNGGLDGRLRGVARDLEQNGVMLGQ